MIDAVLFDLANTLLNFDELRPDRLFHEASNDSYRYLKTLGLSLPNFRDYARAYFWAFGRGIVWSSLRRRDVDCMNVMVTVLKRLNIQLPKEKHRVVAWKWYEAAARRSHVEKGTHEVLGHLMRQGIKMAIISNTLVPASCLDRHLEKEGLLKYFPTRIYSSTVGYKKPHPAIFRLALNALEVQPQRAVFVGDSIRTDICGAHRAGMAAILKNGGRRARAYLYGGRAERIIRQLADLRQILPNFGVREWVPTG
ncbi:MAG: HAD family hydrolase [Planctomycetia bacterium]|nr:HAD family hydrolase [Planctomycetia bacterium]